MTTPPDRPKSPRRTGWLWRYGPLIGAGFLTGIIFSLIQAPDKSILTWVLIVLGAVAAAVMWTTGIRRYSAGATKDRN
ncbi:MAG TPA: hypothetical protein VFM62_04380 [Arthrobacter sp.]|nr:hypothetical protein [Arthrobacter sp.]